MASGPDAINNAPRRRSASLCLNLIATWLDVNEATLPPPAPGSLAREVELAVQVENAYVGSPCGELDQIMIYYAKKGFGTYYDPATAKIDYVPMGEDAPAWATVWNSTLQRHFFNLRYFERFRRSALSDLRELDER